MIKTEEAKPMRRWLSLLIILLAAMLFACNGDDDEDETPPDAQGLITEAAQNFNQASSFRLELRQDGVPTKMDVALSDDLVTSITVQRAEAFFVSPDRVRARVSVSQESDATIDIDLVVVEDRQYIGGPLISLFLDGDEWLATQFAADFEAGDLQSPENGIGAALLAMQNIEYVGTADVSGGVPVYHVRGTVSAEKVRSVTVGLMATEAGEVGIDVYIRRQGTRHVAQIELEEPTPEGNKTWIIQFNQYDDTFVIEEPLISD